MDHKRFANEKLIMEIRVLRYFLAIVSEGSFTAAAQKLHVSQPALTRQIKDLEDELGKVLFERGSRRVSLTDDGRFLEQRAREIVALTDQTKACFASNTTDISGPIYLSVGESTGFSTFARAMEKMQTAYPAVMFEVYSCDGQDVIDNLDNGRADFGLFVGQNDLQKYHYLTLPEKNHWGALIHKNDIKPGQSSINAAELSKYPLICSRRAISQNEIMGWFGKYAEELRIVASHNLVYNASLMVKAGLGVTITLNGLINTTNDPVLRFIPLDPPLYTSLNVAWKRGRIFSRQAGVFFEYLKREIDPAE